MLIKLFRLFVSSTFADFERERQLLQSKVFPALDAYCAAKGFQFHAIDLRWGVNEEAQLDQRTTDICLGEVAAAKRRMLSGVHDGSIRLWEISSGSSRFLGRHRASVRAVAFSPDGRLVISGCEDRTLILHEVESGRELARLDGDGGFNAIRFAADGKSVAVGDREGRVHLFDISVDDRDRAAWLARRR